MASDLSHLARELLVAERGRQEDDELKARAMERARAALDRPSGVGFRQARAVAVHPRPRRWLRTLPLVAAAVAAASLAIAGVGAYAWQAPEAPLRLRPMKTRVPRTTPLAIGGGLVESAHPSDVAPERTPPAAPTTATAENARLPSVKQYSTELMLLEPARSSIAHGDFGAALAAIAQHRREFPNGQLTEEREALRVRALWGLGQRPAALAAAKVFRKRYPRSGLLSWLKAEHNEGP